jgi:flavodoxin
MFMLARAFRYPMGFSHMSVLKTLVVYYSSDGYTRDAALELALQLDADMLEIQDLHPRKGFRGRVRSMVEAVFDIPARTLPFSKDPFLYDLVVIGTPVWNGKVSSPIRTFLIRTWDPIAQRWILCRPQKERYRPRAE